MRIEKPESGRAIIREEGGSLRITIPRKWNILTVLIILFLLAWLGGWAFGEITAIGTLIKGNGGSSLSSGNAFLSFWLIAWTVGGVAVIGFTLWYFFSKEMITVASDILTIENKVLNVGRTKRYAFSDIKNLRISRQDVYGFGTMFNYPRFSKGTLAFDYGLKTIRFASNIDEAEAEHISGLIKQRSGYFR